MRSAVLILLLSVPPVGDVNSGRVLLQHWAREAEQARATVWDISDRSRLFGPDIRRFQRVIGELCRLHREGVEALDRGDSEAAWARLNALWIGLPVVALQIQYVALASRAEDAGVLTAHWTAILKDMDRRTGPIIDAVATVDTRRIEDAVRPRRDDLIALQTELPRIEQAMAKGARWSRQGVFVANGLTLALAAYQSVAALDGLGAQGPELTFRFPALAGAPSSGIVAIPVGVLESLQHLARTGALSNVVLATGAGLAGGAPEPLLPRPGVVDQKLRNIIDNLYKGTTHPNRVGTGTTADAVKSELSTGQPTAGKFHLQKARESVRALENWLKANPNGAYGDRLAAQSLRDELVHALEGQR